MRESLSHQAVLDEGRVEEARKIVLRLGTERFGRPGRDTRAALEHMTDLDPLEQLTVRLLHVANWEDLLTEA